MPRTVGPAIAPGAMSAHQQPVITIDDELVLRPWDAGDALVLIDAFDDPDIQFWHGFRIDNVDEAHEWVARAHTGWQEEKSVNWAVCAQSSGDLLGRVALYTQLAHGIAEIAYWILPTARRGRVAVRAAVAATSWAHDSLGVHRVELQHSVANTASCRVAGAAGYVVEGTHRQKDLHADGWHDMHQHAHVRDLDASDP